jgi:hypothetical protein
LTREELAEVLEFDETISKFRWKTRTGGTNGHAVFNSRFAGKVAGQEAKRGENLYYRTICINHKVFYEHHLVWLQHYGELPKTRLDHRNGDSSDNRVENLRAVSHGDNLRNMARRKDNTSGHTGVVWDKSTSRYLVRVWAGGKSVHGGCFKKEDLLLAAAKAKELRASLGYSPTHGLTREQRKNHEPNEAQA